MRKAKLFLLASLAVLVLLVVPLNSVVAKGGSKKSTDCSANVVHDGILDQQQCKYSGGLSARTSPYNSVWQSFTAGKTGILTESDMGFFGNINGMGTLAVYPGEGINTTALYSARVTVLCSSNDCAVPFTVSVPVTEGEMYTFRFIPGYGMPDPYGVQVGSHNAYKAGVLGYDVMGTSTLTSYDAVFSTFVK